MGAAVGSRGAEVANRVGTKDPRGQGEDTAGRTEAAFVLRPCPLPLDPFNLTGRIA